MKAYQLLVLLISLLFVSCDDILFEKPQPPWIGKSEATFPDKLRGIYASTKKDTIRIDANSIAPLHPKKDDVIFTLSDSILLRADKDYYYLNIRTEQYWDVTLGKLKGDSLFSYTLSSKDEEVRKTIGKITPLKDIKGDSGNYVINPSSEEFRKILDKNIFKQADVYVRVRKLK